MIYIGIDAAKKKFDYCIIDSELRIIKRGIIINNTIPKEYWYKFEGGQDKIGNLQLLEGIPNEEKSAQDFDKWVIQNYPSVDSRKEYKSKNYIPLDSDLKFENFLEFLRKREGLIKLKLMEILEVDKT